MSPPASSPEGTPSAGAVHVICAPPNGRNPGMTSVDLAFAGVASEAGADTVVHWRLWDQTEWVNSPGGSERLADGRFFDADSGIAYRQLRGHLDEALDAPCVVYWGDFQHMAVYQRHTVDVLTGRMRAYATTSEAAVVVAQHLMLRGRAPDELARVVSFGSTLGFNTVTDYTPPYEHDLETLLRGAHRVWFRDAYSAQVAASARSPREEHCKGLDAAFLLPPPTLDGPHEETLGIFFGRSQLQPEPLARFGERLSRRLGLRPAWINWGREPAFWPMNSRRRFRLAWPGLEHGSAAPDLTLRLRTYVDAARGASLQAGSASTDELLAQLARCALVVTDTYHVAVNSWRVGTPAICVLDKPRTSWSVNSGECGERRDKREDLYSGLDALPLLVDGSRLTRGVAREVDRVQSWVSDTATIGITHRRVADLTRQSRAAVVGAVSQLLARRFP